MINNSEHSTSAVSAGSTFNQRVAVMDIQMPFGSMITFMVKWAIASIPAMIILMVVGAMTLGVVATVIASFMHASSVVPW